MYDLQLLFKMLFHMVNIWWNTNKITFWLR